MDGIIPLDPGSNHAHQVLDKVQSPTLNLGVSQHCKPVQVLLIQNNGLIARYAVKKQQMFQKGLDICDVCCYTTEDLKCALVVCSHGLTVRAESCPIGRVDKGIHLSKYPDVSLSYAEKADNKKPLYLIVYKVLLGRSKLIQQDLTEMGGLLFPDPKYNSYLSSWQPHVEDNIDLLRKKSSVYLFDYDKEKLLISPRHCLPYAVIIYSTPACPVDDALRSEIVQDFKDLFQSRTPVSPDKKLYIKTPLKDETWRAKRQLNLDEPDVHVGKLKPLKQCSMKTAVKKLEKKLKDKIRKQVFRDEYDFKPSSKSSVVDEIDFASSRDTEVGDVQHSSESNDNLFASAFLIKAKPGTEHERLTAAEISPIQYANNKGSNESVPDVIVLSDQTNNLGSKSAEIVNHRIADMADAVPEHVSLPKNRSDSKSKKHIPPRDKDSGNKLSKHDKAEQHKLYQKFKDTSSSSRKSKSNHEHCNLTSKNPRIQSPSDKEKKKISTCSTNQEQNSKDKCENKVLPDKPECATLLNYKIPIITQQKNVSTASPHSGLSGVGRASSHNDVPEPKTPFHHSNNNNNTNNNKCMNPFSKDCPFSSPLYDAEYRRSVTPSLDNLVELGYCDLTVNAKKPNHQERSHSWPSTPPVLGSGVNRSINFSSRNTAQSVLTKVSSYLKKDSYPASLLMFKPRANNCSMGSPLYADEPAQHTAPKKETPILSERDDLFRSLNAYQYINPIKEENHGTQNAHLSASNHTCPAGYAVPKTEQPIHNESNHIFKSHNTECYTSAIKDENETLNVPLSASHHIDAAHYTVPKKEKHTHSETKEVVRTLNAHQCTSAIKVERQEMHSAASQNALLSAGTIGTIKTSNSFLILRSTDSKHTKIQAFDGSDNYRSSDMTAKPNGEGSLNGHRAISSSKTTHSTKSNTSEPIWKLIPSDGLRIVSPKHMNYATEVCGKPTFHGRTLLKGDNIAARCIPLKPIAKFVHTLSDPRQGISQINKLNERIKQLQKQRSGFLSAVCLTGEDKTSGSQTPCETQTKELDRFIGIEKTGETCSENSQNLAQYIPAGKQTSYVSDSKHLISTASIKTFFDKQNQESANYPDHSEQQDTIESKYGLTLSSEQNAVLEERYHVSSTNSPVISQSASEHSFMSQLTNKRVPDRTVSLSTRQQFNGIIDLIQKSKSCTDTSNQSNQENDSTTLSSLLNVLEDFANSDTMKVFNKSLSTDDASANTYIQSKLKNLIVSIQDHVKPSSKRSPGLVCHPEDMDIDSDDEQFTSQCRKPENNIEVVNTSNNVPKQIYNEHNILEPYLKESLFASKSPGTPCRDEGKKLTNTNFSPDVTRNVCMSDKTLDNTIHSTSHSNDNSPSVDDTLPHKQESTPNNTNTALMTEQSSQLSSACSELVAKQNDTIASKPLLGVTQSESGLSSATKSKFTAKSFQTPTFEKGCGRFYSMVKAREEEKKYNPDSTKIPNLMGSSINNNFRFGFNRNGYMYSEKFHNGKQVQRSNFRSAPYSGNFRSRGWGQGRNHGWGRERGWGRGRGRV